METWQQNHIRNNLPKLVESTDCNESLLSYLKSKDLLSSEEIQQIQNYKVKHRKATYLFEILETRTDSFRVLLKALVKTKQSGAYFILNARNFISINHIGNLEVTRETCLGRTSIAGDLEFFKGKFGTRDIAIRRENYSKSLTGEISSIETEVAFLTQLDCHENILRFFTCKIDTDLVHVLLVFELCSSTLDEYLREENQRITQATKKSILQQLANGLYFLHCKNITYLNLRPSSILVSKNLPLNIRPKFSNFGSAATVSSNGTGRISSEKLIKNAEWLPGNVLKSISQGQEEIDVDTTVDIFSLGCLFHFILFSAHPFGEMFCRTNNIVKNIPYEQPDDKSICKDLISKMLVHEDSVKLPLEFVVSTLTKEL